MNLSTQYMGIGLKNPLLVGASPLSDDIDVIRRFEDAGVAGVVMHSLFMEQISRDQIAMHYHLDAHNHAHAEAVSYFPDADDFALGPDAYIEQVRRLKEAVEIPVIASLNGICVGDWIHHAKLIEQAGADGIEVNVYYLPLYGDESPAAVEARHVNVVSAVCDQVEIPIAVKMHSMFSSPIYTARRLIEAGAKGIVLFNRLFHPEIDIEELEVRPVLHLSSRGMLEARLLWLAAMYGQVEASLAVTGGVSNTVDVIRSIMAGASATQMTSALLRGGPGHAGDVLRDLETWLTEHDYQSLEQMCGSMSLRRCPDPEAFERANYLRTLQAWDGGK
ncbi:MAG: dihydroorotate dehydrogenase (fumarate) [Kiritimatiellia bacterium]|jgi:dihydroorotate dehydrogenase (fumarate)